MPQHDYIVSASAREPFLADLNFALLSIATNNSGRTSPTANFKYQFYANEATNKLQMRDGNDPDTWHDLWDLNAPLGNITVNLQQGSVYDVLKNIVQAGSNINLTADDTNNRLTITSTASGGGGGGGTSITIQNQGSSLRTAASVINFSGSGVTASGTGTTKRITIPGFSPTRSNLYTSIRSMFVGGTNTTVTTNDSARTIAINSTASGGGGSFTPSQANIYSAVKAIFIPGANTTLTESDRANTIAVNATGGGSGGTTFTPSKANLFSAVREIIVHSSSPAAAADAVNNEIDITNVDNTARTSAANAQTTANTALDEANTARGIANTANTNANNALNRALFSPTQENIYVAVRDILVHSSSPGATADNFNREINITNVDNTKLNQNEVDARVNALAILQGEVDEIDVLTEEQYNALVKDTETMYLVEGETTFTPSQANIYSAVKAIFIPGANTTLTESDGPRTIAVNATDPFTPSKATLYAAVKDILVHSSSPAAAADDTNREIDITNVDTVARTSANAKIPQGDVTAMDSLSQAEYDLITTKSATTLYIITS